MWSFEYSIEYFAFVMSGWSSKSNYITFSYYMSKFVISGITKKKKNINDFFFVFCFSFVWQLKRH
jgi:hypothetical protein